MEPKTEEFTQKDLESVLAAIKTFPEAEKLKSDELEKVAFKALQTGQTQSEEWLKDQLVNFHQHEKEDLKKEEVKQIIPSEPTPVQSQVELDSVIDEHQKWIEGLMQRVSLSEGKRANLNEANLAGMTLKDKNLSCASLENTSFIATKLVGVNFSAANLTGANFSGAYLENCRFKKAKLSEANFGEAEIHNCNFSEEQKEEAHGLFLHISEN